MSFPTPKESQYTSSDANTASGTGVIAPATTTSLKSEAKDVESQSYCLAVPTQHTPGQASSRYSVDTSRSSSDDGSSSQLSRHRLSRSEAPSGRRSWQETFHELWVTNKGLALVMLSQFFGVMMNVTTRLLERPSKYGSPMHPFQILFARMVGTLALSFTYQWWAKVKDAPFGPRSVWLLLIARGVGGFFGVYGMYYSLIYLDLADATVITFLAPTVACYACSILIKEPFTRSEQLAGLVSFLGVVIIAQPGSIFSDTAHPPPSAGNADSGLSPPNSTSTAGSTEAHATEITPEQRLSAVAVALVGVLGAASAYTTIRWIGQRAHPLISVNYFAAWSALVSTVALVAVHDVNFQLPAGWVQWSQLIFLGICGFVMQFLLTAGLAYEKSSRATNMVYTQMLFALAFDKIVWNTSPGLMSILGSSLILGSALYVAVLKNQGNGTRKAEEPSSQEEQGLLPDDEFETGSTRDDNLSLRNVHEVQLRTLRV